MSEGLVRPASAHDVQAITALQLASIQATAHEAGADVDIQALRPQILSGWEQTLTKPAPPGCFTMVAVHGSQVVGVVCAVPGEPLEGPVGLIEAGSDIITWSVDTNFRRSGHASRMFAALVRLLDGASVRAWAGAEDTASVRFLQACGFGPSGLQRTLDVGGKSVTQHLWFAALPH